MAKLFVTSDWSLIPGPDQIEEPFYSTSMDEISQYAPESIARAIISFPDTRLLHPAEPSWWDWQARWERGGRRIDINMTLFEGGETSWWGGCILGTSCNISDLVDLWSSVRASHPAVWLHAPDCRIYSPDSFMAKYAT